MTAFLRRHPDATEDVLTTEAGRARAVGRQILPGEAGMDGFYYARLRKN
jgi:16S rRNA (cytosine967-C5)-methyltransferase